MACDALAHVQAVAVLVDDLDRCVPEAVIESLEAIRLFLAVPKMSFVVAADEDRVADAIRTRFADTGAPPREGRRGRGADQALPALDRPDDHFALDAEPVRHAGVPAASAGRAHFSTESFGEIVGQCATIRRDGGVLDDLKPVEGVEMRAGAYWPAMLWRSSRSSGR